MGVVQLLYRSLTRGQMAREITITLPKPTPAQAQILAGMKRFNVVCAGRRFGKNILLQRRIVKKALKLQQPVAWAAPTYRMLSDDWVSLRNILQPVTKRAREDEHRLDLITGNPIEMWSLENPDNIRGRKYGHIVINEAAMVRNLVDIWGMVIRPTLVDFQGGADFGSTPRGLNGYYTLWSEAEKREDWARFRFRTEDNPNIPTSEIEAMKSSLPERVIQQEIEAQFIQDGGYFQGIDKVAIIGQPDQPAQHPGHHLVIGIDWALSEDWTVITVGCKECHKVVDWKRFNQIDFVYQRQAIVEMATRWKAEVLPERNSIGEPNIEILVQNKLTVLSGPDGRRGFNTTATSKPLLIQNLATGLEHNSFLVPADYAEELRAYEVDTAGASPKFGAPSGLHDDRVISLALTWWAMTKAGSGWSIRY